jgi:photosynthetic reaction center cytochrome c subunit
MKVGSRRTALGAVGMSVVFLVAAALVGGPAAQAQAPAQSQLQALAAAALAQAPAAAALAQIPRDQLAEVAFKNVQVLRGISVDEFLSTMGFMAASTGLNCTYCHSGNDYTVAAYAADTIQLKLTARKMIVIMNTINQSFFSGRQVVTCWTCHQGEQVPHNVPNLRLQYSQVLPYEPDDAAQQAPFQPTADEVFNKYLEAVGGAQRVNTLTSIVAKGTNTGYGPEDSPRPLELYATAAGARTTITETADGNATATFDGRNGWMAIPHKPAPFPVLPLYGDDLAGAKLDATLMFPGKIKQALTDLRVGFPFTMPVPTIYIVKPGDTLASIARSAGVSTDAIRFLSGLSSNAVTPGQRLIVKSEDRDMVVVQGRTGPGRPLDKLIFDSETGLLMRLIRYTGSPIGRVPTQIDYRDYTVVNGVKLPLTWEVTWTDGRETYQIDPKQLQVNVAVPDSRFAKPAPPVKTASR